MYSHKSKILHLPEAVRGCSIEQLFLKLIYSSIGNNYHVVFCKQSCGTKPATLPKIIPLKTFFCNFFGTPFDLGTLVWSTHVWSYCRVFDISTLILTAWLVERVIFRKFVVVFRKNIHNGKFFLQQKKYLVKHAIFSDRII